MDTVIRIDPPLPMDTPKGPAWAHLMIDRGQDHRIEWVCFLRASGKSFTFQNPQIRIAANYTTGTNSDLQQQQPTPSTAEKWNSLVEYISETDGGIFWARAVMEHFEVDTLHQMSDAQIQHALANPDQFRPKPRASDVGSGKPQEALKQLFA